MLWVEKYRPKKFSEIKGQEKIVERLRAMVQQKNIQNLLFAGPPGVGKSTLALIITYELYGEEWQQNFLELNASDDRGIDVVRNTIKDFARTKSLGNVPFKIIFLDECDSLTREAQQALRRTMENYSNNTRFILSCNYSSKIIDPITSRCTVFRFKPLEYKDVRVVVQEIGAKEDLNVTEDAISALFKISEGDCRKIENMLQTCAVIDKEIGEDLVYSLISAARPKEVVEICSLAVKGDFIKAKTLLLDTMLKYGLSGLDMIKQIQKEAWALETSDERKLQVIEKCGEIEFRMVEGSDEFLQLESLIAYIAVMGKI